MTAKRGRSSWHLPGRARTSRDVVSECRRVSPSCAAKVRGSAGEGEVTAAPREQPPSQCWLGQGSSSGGEGELGRGRGRGRGRQPCGMQPAGVARLENRLCQLSPGVPSLGAGPGQSCGAAASLPLPEGEPSICLALHPRGRPAPSGCGPWSHR